MRDFHRDPGKVAGCINVGDVVILHDEKLPRHRWSLCKVLEVIPGRDGIIRGARIKMRKPERLWGEVLADRGKKKVTLVDARE